MKIRKMKERKIERDRETLERGKKKGGGKEWRIGSTNFKYLTFIILVLTAN